MELKHILDILRKRLWFIILLPIIITGLYATIKAANYQPIYESYTTLYIIDKTEESSITYENIMISEQLVKDYRELIKSKAVTSKVIEELGIEDISHGGLINNINASFKNDTRILEIRVRDHNPQRVKMITDKVSEVFIKKAIELMNIDNVNIIDYAQVPEYPIANRTVYQAFICFIVSLPVIIGLVLLREFLNNNINSIDDVENYLKLEVLGIIPTFEID